MKMNDYPYMVREFKDGKLTAVAHNLFESEAETELLGNINGRDYRKQSCEHKAEDADSCPECLAEMEAE
jgi:hypothetical protein